MKEKIEGSLLKDNQNIKYAPHMIFKHKLTFPFPSKRISTVRMNFEISLVLYHTGIVMGVFSGELERQCILYQADPCWVFLKDNQRG